VWSISGRLDVGRRHETADVRNGAHGGRDEPRQTEHGTDGDQARQDEQVQMIPVSLLQHDRQAMSGIFRHFNTVHECDERAD